MRSRWITFFVIVCGGAFGTLIGNLCKNVPYLSWLGYSKEIGLSINDPLYLNLLFFELKFGFSLNLSIATVIFIFVALLIYRKLR